MNLYRIKKICSRALLVTVIAMVPVPGSFLVARQASGLKLAAGDGTAGFSDAEPVRFNKPIRLAPYGDDAILVADIYNHAIRIVTLDGRVKTVTGGPDKKGHRDGPASEAMFDSPHGVAFNPADGEIVVAEAGNHTIRRLVPTDRGVPLLERDYTVSTPAGVPGESGYQNGPAREARLK